MSEENVTPAPKMPPEPASVEQSIDRAHDSIEQFIASADVSRVYGEPIKEGDVTIIPTAEVLTGMGFGYGSGFGREKESEQGGHCRRRRG
ncbi:MAG: hypothetical protein M1281_10405, partial [Chloroflexi bacterium]|nr:hypothetical protein [Chloroflexota bacterium]